MSPFTESIVEQAALARLESAGWNIDKNNDKPQVILSAARIIARLHARGKPNEQEKRFLRPLMEADAEFALAAVGLLLRELSWTR